jgi:hypothetical protein
VPARVAHPILVAGQKCDNFNAGCLLPLITDVDANYLSRFQVQKVGGAKHLEYWIPAEQLEEFNRHIVGVIRVIAQFTKDD